MRPCGPSADLFAAFTRINSGAFRDNRLLSCPTLSKAPNYGRVLDRWLRKEPPARRGALYCLRTALGYTAANGGHLLFLMLGALYVRLLGWKRPTALTEARALLIIDSFALLPEIAREGRFKERYLPGLAEAAAEQGRAVVRLHRLYGSRAPGTLWRALKALAKSDTAANLISGTTAGGKAASRVTSDEAAAGAAAAGARCAANGMAGHLLEVHLFTPGDWLRLILHFFSYPFALAGLIRSLGGYADDSPEAAIREALLDSAGQCVLTGEARRIAGYRLGLLSAKCQARRPASADGTGGAHDLRIASWYENQTVNKCLHRGLAEAEDRTGRHVPVTGAQLFLWPAALLNNHADDGEAALKLTPDKVLVNGSWYLPDHTAQHYAVGPSLRYGHLFAPARDLETREPDASPRSATAHGAAAAKVFPPDGSIANAPLLALLSYHPEETRRVLELVLPLALQKGGAGVAYRFHPATRPEDFAALLPPAPKFSTGPLMEAFYAAGAVLGAGSGSLVEAAALGVPVLSVTGEPDSPEEGLNYLPDIGRGVLWERVSRADDVAGALERLAVDPGKRKEQARSLRDALFCEPTRECVCRAFDIERVYLKK